MGIDTNQYANQLLAENAQLKADNSTLRQTRADLSREANKLESERDEARAELARRDAATGKPVTNPVLGYADSYRGMAARGVKNIPIWAVITDLERNIAPLYSAAQPAVLPPEMIPERAHEIGLLEGVDLSHMRRCIAADSYNQAIADAKALGCQPTPVVKLPAQVDSGSVEYGGSGAFNMGKRCGINEGIIRCSAALDAAGVKLEVTGEKSD